MLKDLEYFKFKKIDETASDPYVVDDGVTKYYQSSDGNLANRG